MAAGAFNMRPELIFSMKRFHLVFRSLLAVAAVAAVILAIVLITGGNDECKAKTPTSATKPPEISGNDGCK
jgi:hypothetical protein